MKTLLILAAIMLFSINLYDCSNNAKDMIVYADKIDVKTAEDYIDRSGYIASLQGSVGSPVIGFF